MKLPLRIQRHESSFGIRDAHDTAILYVYFDKGNAGERAIRKLMSEEEAEEIAKRVARFLTDDAQTKKSPPAEASGAAYLSASASTARDQ